MDLRSNNFDLLRLLAATQVLVVHGIDHLYPDWIFLKYVLSFFPGVPIFFVISGFLISASYERNPNLWQYAQNRILRIFPALWVCLTVSIFLAMVVGRVHFPIDKTIPWLIAQATFFQFYNPDFLRSFGVGVLNGSLWTITIELQFYFTLPIIYLLLRGARDNIKFLVTLAIFAIFNLLVISMRSTDIIVDKGSLTLYKLLGVFLPTYLYLFLIGIFLQRNYTKLAPFLEGKAFVFWLPLYIFFAFIALLLGFSKSGNYLHPLLATFLGLTTISLAVTMPNLSKKLLKNNDISYGVYIYHMPIINVLNHLGLNEKYAIFLTFILTYFIAFTSWKFVEKPALSLKKNPLHPTIIN